MAEFCDDLKDILMQYINGLRSTPSGWLKTNCQICHLRGHNADQKQRFGILFNPGGGIGANCFNCGFSTAWQPGHELGSNMIFLLSGIGVPKADIDKLRFNSFINKSNDHSFAGGLTGAVTKKWVPVEEPLPDCHTIRFWLDNDCSDPDFIKVVEYALDRNILDIDKMAWTPHHDSLFHKRLTIPYYYKGELVGWTGRLAVKTKSNAPKYHNTMPLSFIYGLDDQDDYDKQYVIINEGVIDAIVTNGIGVLHNNINEEQARIINTIPAHKILCPDRDTSGDNLIEIAIQNKWSVAFPNWYKDASGEIIKDASQAAQIYGSLLTIQSIITSAEHDSFKIRMKRKLDKDKYGY